MPKLCRAAWAHPATGMDLPELSRVPMDSRRRGVSILLLVLTALLLAQSYRIVRGDRALVRYLESR